MRKICNTLSCILNYVLVLRLYQFLTSVHLQYLIIKNLEQERHHVQTEQYLDYQDTPGGLIKYFAELTIPRLINSIEYFEGKY